MDDQKKPTQTSASLRDGLQWLREGMAVVISVVILALAAVTISETFVSAGSTAKFPAGADEKTRQYQIDAYNRQKDIMLYVVSLFGTVTGYYLGRVPAEANAKRAERAADTAQNQLARTQDRLADTTAAASTASALLSQSREEKAQVSKRLKQSAAELRNVSETISKLHKPHLPGTGALGIREGEPAYRSGVEAELQEAQRRIEVLLAQIEED
jgi:Na+-transporting methylmalonyl-CoA/oxaloacetate decarboxylase gamma subunit